jgi:hypothetical protein
VSALRCYAGAIVVALVVCTAADAQEANDPWTDARFHLGPVALSPAISIANVGVDTNVFASADDRQRDWTATFIPATTAVLRLGRGQLSGQGDVTYQYFRRFESERSLSSRGTLRLDVPLNRLELAFGGSAVNTRQRQGAEITARVRRFENAVNVAANVRISGQSRVGIIAGRTRYSFPADAVFLDTNLQRVLEREEDRVGVVFSNRFTPLTTFRATAERQRDRFVQSPARNADSTRVLAGFEMSPQTLLQGSAFIGYQMYEPVLSSVPKFDGVVANGDVTYIAWGTTRLNVRADRGLAYSYDVLEPYYITTGVAVSVAQHLRGRLELLASVGRQRLDYRRQELSPTSAPSRRDASTTYGAGLGYGFGHNGRIRVNFDGSTRRSAFAPQNFDSQQFTTSIDYAF